MPKNPPIFLSIDSDFFDARHEIEFATVLDACTKHHNISAVMNHQQMLPLVNKSSARILLNLDRHSDLGEGDETEALGCGSWVNYVKWRGEGRYIWVHPDDPDMIGDCNGGPKLFVHKQTAPNLPVSWGAATHHTFPDDRECLDIVVQWLNIADEVCICMSPDYTVDTGVIEFREWVKRSGVKYRKGIKNESDWYTDRKPPRSEIKPIPVLEGKLGTSIRNLDRLTLPPKKSKPINTTCLEELGRLILAERELQAQAALGV